MSKLSFLPLFKNKTTSIEIFRVFFFYKHKLTQIVCNIILSILFMNFLRLSKMSKHK